ncbi:SDR family NAD(P)-dependent oxidoreductase [Geopsychrobacter electrodiphilus]|uniref:SDR family NAD(P)-dependent oxidoreductase n=1 Tax=Geopsychrobacter electrodiphilus TaxID=225196 RepID=UPI000368B332|nr:SDR family NAD(P)-dependent oxidoreductase [Geopsychrobacter electrodiphilus]
MARIVLITGASAGFGAAIARHFAAKGDRLILTARRLERLEKLRAELESSAQIHLVQLDVRDRSQVEEKLRQLPEAFAAVDILVNNAGLALGLGPAQQAELDDWDTMIDTNCKGLTYCTRVLLPGMVERNRGHVVNIASAAGSYAYPGANVYGASKAFVLQFSDNLRADLLGTRVRVSCIAPGMAETEFSLVRFKGDVERARGLYAGSNAMTASDIAHAVMYVTDQPEHLNINHIEMMPITQAPAGLKVLKTPG